MNEIEIRELLQQKYNRDNWSKLLDTVFNNSKIFSKAKEILPIEPAKRISHIGNIELDENKTLSFIEVEVVGNVQLNRNRVQLRNLTSKLVDQDVINGALVIYYKPKEKDYRFSFIAKQSEFTKDGEFKKTETHPKRYTYILGENESCVTAAQRFIKLAENDNLFVSLNDVLDAFNVEKLSKEFFKEYKEFYTKFIDDILSSKSKKVLFKDEKHIRDFVKKMLGRIVFLYFVQKKGWLGATDTKYKDGNHNFIQTLFELSGKSASFYPVWLTELFFETLNSERTDDNFKMPNGTKVKIPYLNGGLFEKDENDKEIITFKPKLFDELFQFFARFNFTIYEDSPEEQTVAVDPEMLGHIFENLLEDNKDKGAFYTPKEIVHYMTQESLIEYLHTHLPKLKRIELEHFVKEKDLADFASLREHLLEINQLLTTVKICDPAIGSGAFPMGLLQEIFILKELIQFQEGFKIESPAKLKESIIQNSIYGVDIEQGAVDIARLRFWLSLVVDEEKPKPLPNLDYKIIVGNSLVSKFEDEVIEIDWDKKEFSTGKVIEYELKIKKILEQIVIKQKKYFQLDSTNKTKLKKQIRDLKIELLINHLNAEREKFKSKADFGGGNLFSSKKTKKHLENEIKLASFGTIISKLVKYKRESQKLFPHFDWKLDFPEILNPTIAGDNPGFDIVIGNPPYIKEAVNKSAFDDVRNQDCYQGKMDIWYLFGAKGIGIIKNGGQLCFIATNNWITNDGASKFRNIVLSNSKIIEFIDFRDYKVFYAGIQTMILILTKINNPKKNEVKYSVINNTSVAKNILEEFLNSKFPVETSVYQKSLVEFINKDFINSYISFLPLSISNIINKMKSVSDFQLKKDEIHSGIDAMQEFITKKHLSKLNANHKVNDGVFIINDEERKKLKLNPHEINLVKPFYMTKEINRYYANAKNTLWILYTSAYVNSHTNKYPNIKRHLDQFQKIITSVNKPYGLHRTRNINNFLGDKLLSIRKCSVPSFSFVDYPSFVTRAFLLIKSDRINLKFLLGLLNSTLIAYWLEKKGKMQGSNFQIDKEPLLNIPLLNPKKSVQKNLIKLATQIISDKKLKKDTTTLEQQIDNMVYKLYALTYKEVLVVQPNFTEVMSKKEYDLFKMGE